MTALFGADPYFIFIIGFGIVFMIAMLSFLGYFFSKKIKEEQKQQSKK
ncbi:hypothetical protein GCM10007162_18390 [Ignatzschineria ureiclastica]|nr:hypothetical protein [Ignatzschineria ureiclastica]GHA02409.1 hypothetical protein GCM10007162_18390 [Ignatzschineria ureiclastica]